MFRRVLVFSLYLATLRIFAAGPFIADGYWTCAPDELSKIKLFPFDAPGKITSVNNAKDFSGQITVDLSKRHLLAGAD